MPASDVPPGGSPRTRGPRVGRSPALWERILQADARHGASRKVEDLALLIEYRPTTGGGATLPMRPVVRGKRDGWVRSGVTWRELTDASRRFDDGVSALLGEIVTLGAGGYSYYYDDRPAIELTTFPSARIWSVLAAAQAAGLPLIGDTSGAPVILEPEPVAPEIDVSSRPDGSWTLAADVVHRGHPIGVPLTLLGNPAHGIAYVAERFAPDATGFEARRGGPLHLARFSRPLDAALHDLVSIAGPVPVPAADRARFTSDYLPALRRQAEVVSRDGSAEVPGGAEVRLLLGVRRDEAGMVVAAWRWRYIWNDEAIDLPLALPARPGMREMEVEAALTAAVLQEVRAMPALVRHGRPTAELVPEAVLSRAQGLRLLREVLPGLRAVPGVEVEVLDGALDFREAVERPVVAMAGSLTPDKDWLDLTVTITVDGEEVPFVELFRALAASAPMLILPSGTYFALNTPELERLRVVIEESYALADRDPVRPATLRLSRYQAEAWDELEVMGALDEQALAWSHAVRALARLDEIPRFDVPAGVTAQLRPYQLAGYRWIAFLQEYGLGGVLADDMGLGKTLQTLTMIARARVERPDGAPFLVVAPTSVVPGWAEEAARFTPGLSAVVVSGTRARRGTELAAACAGADVVVTSYALFRLEYESYAGMEWSGLLLDEAQQIKNHHSQSYRCARALPAPFKLAITGTPLENNLMELWALFSIVAPGLLAEPKRFTEHFRGPIERGQDVDRLATLRGRIRPVLLRRTKADVEADLPPKSEQVLELELLPAHRRVYQRYLQRERRKVLGLLGDLDRHRFQIFRSLTLLRQAALDVALLDDDAATVSSTKLTALVELVTAAAAEGHRVLVFSQFTRFLGRARAELQSAGVDSCYLDGATRNRPAVLREFREGSAPVFLISLKAGGVGLNLTEADYCIITDPWWNPATEQQAVDRAHRIGQHRSVMVYRLLAKDTIEEKVMALKARKAALFSAIMTDGGVGSGGLTVDDIRALLS